MSSEPLVLGVVASPTAGGRTATAVEAVLAGARTKTRLVSAAETPTADILAAISEADAVVFGSPVYRAGTSSMLKSLLEQTQRGMYGEEQAPLAGKAAAVVMTGATPHHYLAGDDLRSVLSGFFAVQVLAPNLYFHSTAFADPATLTPEAAARARTTGEALADLTSCVRASASIQSLVPQV